MSNSIPTDNTLRQVRTLDLLGLKDAINQFIGWYVMNCEIIREISEQMIESEDDVLSLIYARGLHEAQEQGRRLTMTNTLRKMTLGDATTFKDCLSTFITWYQMNYEKIREIAEVWIESEDETFFSILSKGLTLLEQQTDIIKEADRNAQ